MNALRAGAVLAVTVAVALAAATQASADHGASSPAHTHMEVRPMAASAVMGVPVAGEYVLSVRLVMEDGDALAYRSVRFYEQVELFGPREALLGEAETDSGGIATLKYRPSVSGERALLVRYLGDPSHEESRVAFTVQVSEIVPAYQAQPRPFEALQPWLPLTAGLLLSSVWLVLIGAFVRTLLSVRRTSAS